MRPSQPRELKGKDDKISSHRGFQSHEEFARSFALNQKILKCKSLDELQDICRHNVSEFNDVNVATACRRYTKLFTFSYRRKLDSQRAEHAIQVLSVLFTRMKEILAVDDMAFGGKSFSMKTCSTIWWTCGTLSPIFGSQFLQIVSDDDLDVLETKTIDVIVNEHDKFEAQSVATFLWAKVRMENISFVSGTIIVVARVSFGMRGNEMYYCLRIYKIVSGTRVFVPFAQRSKERLFRQKSYARLRTSMPSICRRPFGVRIEFDVLVLCLLKQADANMSGGLTFYLCRAIQHFPKLLAVQPRIFSAVSKQG